MIGKIVLMTLATAVSLMAKTPKVQEESVVENFTIDVSCVNECFDLLSATGNFNRPYVNQCLLTCGVSDRDIEDKMQWQEKELDRLESQVDKMKVNKYLGKPFICVQ